MVRLPGGRHLQAAASKSEVRRIPMARGSWRRKWIRRRPLHFILRLTDKGSPPLDALQAGDRHRRALNHMNKYRCLFVCLAALGLPMSAVADKAAIAGAHRHRRRSRRPDVDGAADDLREPDGHRRSHRHATGRSERPGQPGQIRRDRRRVWKSSRQSGTARAGVPYGGLSAGTHRSRACRWATWRRWAKARTLPAPSC